MKRSRQLLTVTIIFFWASEYCHSPYFTPYLQTLGFTAEIIGIMTGIYGFTQTFVRIPMGIVTDVKGCYKETILLGTVFTTVSSFGLMFATHFATIMLCRFLAGIAASSWLAFTVLYTAYYEADESVRAVTNVNALNSAGKFLAFILGTITASLWGYKIPLVCSFLTGLIAVSCAVALKPVPVKREPLQVAHLAAVFVHPAVLAASFFAIMMQIFLQGTVYSFTSAVAEGLGASPLEIGVNTALFTLVQIVSAGFVGKKVLKRLSTTQAVSVGFGAMALSCVMVGFASNMIPLYLAQIIGGVSNLMVNSVLTALIIRRIPQENQSTAVGLFQALYGIGMTLGPLMTGFMAGQQGYSFAYGVMGGLTLLSAALAVIIMPRVDRDR